VIIAPERAGIQSRQFMLPVVIETGDPARERVPGDERLRGRAADQVTLEGQAARARIASIDLMARRRLMDDMPHHAARHIRRP
jgi:hypothetical protein